MGEYTFNAIQANAFKALEDYQKTNNKGVMVMPTGSGKTFLAIKWFDEILKKEPNAKLLFISHSIDILNQVKNEEFERHFVGRNLDYGECYGVSHKIRQITFATVQSLHNRLHRFNPDDFDYIIIDECHHCQSKTYRKVLDYLKDYKFLMGLTATPNRKDRRDITEVLGGIIFSESAYYAIQNDILSNLEYYAVDNDIDFSKIEYNGQHYSEKDFNRKVGIRRYDILILKEYRKLIKKTYKKKKTIAFCSTVAHARRLSKFFNDHGVRAGCLVSEASRAWGGLKERKEIIKEFKEGDTEIIFVRDMFNEGIDIPEADCAMLLRPTQSNTIFHQQIGRVLRKAADKDFALILDFTGNARRFENTLTYLGEYVDFDILKDMKQNSNWAGFGRELVIIKSGLKIRLSRTKIDLINNYFANLQRTLPDAIKAYHEIYGDFEDDD